MHKSKKILFDIRQEIYDVGNLSLSMKLNSEALTKLTEAEMWCNNTLAEITGTSMYAKTHDPSTGDEIEMPHHLHDTDLSYLDGYSEIQKIKYLRQRISNAIAEYKLFLALHKTKTEDDRFIKCAQQQVFVKLYEAKNILGLYIKEIAK